MGSRFSDGYLWLIALRCSLCVNPAPPLRPLFSHDRLLALARWAHFFMDDGGRPPTNCAVGHHGGESSFQIGCDLRT